jgi:hypothetical protein
VGPSSRSALEERVEESGRFFDRLQTGGAWNNEAESRGVAARFSFLGENRATTLRQLV